MKKQGNLIVLGLLSFVCWSANAQDDCSTGRYRIPDYFSAVTKTEAVPFGSNIAFGLSTQTILKMDIYEGTGDAHQARPVVIIGFGGSFTSGSRTSPEVVTLCNKFAMLGYVAIAPDYRIGNFLPDQRTTTLAVMRAVHDYKGAIRFLRKSVVEDGNPYRINPDLIFVGGVSAGAVAAIHTAYLNELNEIPSYFTVEDTAGLGGVEGLSGNPGYPTNVSGVLSFSGCIGDTSWIKPGDVPVVSVHESGDPTVPFGTEMISVGSTETGLVASGSRDIHARAQHIGVKSCLRVHEWPLHVGYLVYDPINSPNFAADLVGDIVCGQEPNCGLNEFNVGIGEVDARRISVSPNPVTDRTLVDVGLFRGGNVSYELTDISGRVVMNGTSNTPRFTLNMEALPSGIYAVKVIQRDYSDVQRIIKR